MYFQVTVGAETFVAKIAIYRFFLVHSELMASQVELVACLKAADSAIKLRLFMDSVPMGIQPLLRGEVFFAGRAAVLHSLVLVIYMSA